MESIQSKMDRPDTSHSKITETLRQWPYSMHRVWAFLLLSVGPIPLPSRTPIRLPHRVTKFTFFKSEQVQGGDLALLKQCLSSPGRPDLLSSLFFQWRQVSVNTHHCTCSVACTLWNHCPWLGTSHSSCRNKSHVLWSNDSNCTHQGRFSDHKPWTVTHHEAWI